MRYFHCETNHGIFVSPSKLSKAGAEYKPLQTEKVARPVYKPVVHHGKVDVSHVRAKFHTAMEAIAERTEVRVGDRVWVEEVVAGRGCKGTVRFMGSVDFVDDMSEWLGVELDQPLGRHDGTVQAVRYFAAGPDRGVFVTGNKVSRLRLEEDDDREREGEASPVSPSLAPSPAMSRSVSATPSNSTSTRVRRSLSLRHQERTQERSQQAPSLCESNRTVSR